MLTPTTTRVARRSFGGRRYASIHEAATYYGVEHKFIRALIAKGRLTGFRIPGTKLIKVDLDELDRLAGGDAA